MFNKIARWKPFQVFTLKVLTILYVPLSFLITQTIKEKIFKKLKNYIRDFNRVRHYNLNTNFPRIDLT